MQVVIDTSALIRFFTEDIPAKASLVEKLLEKEKRIFVPDVVFPELEYILVSQHKFSRKELLEVYAFLVSRNNIYMTPQAKASISIFENSDLDMADCVIASYSLKGKLASFDKELLKVEKVKPFWK